ncbi:MAG: sel1 repeat family protein [Hyphomicrobiales bacterium]|nr:sel1 repeat family protein [Hyphomicrobiales bacterium]
MRPFYLWIVMILLLPASLVHAEEDHKALLQDCQVQYSANSPLAIAVCKKLAEKDVPAAQKIMGDMYFWGFTSIPRNYEQAAYWYKKAAVNDDVEAQYNSGVMYEQGKGMPVDYARAFKWFLSAAKKGYAPAQFNVANMFSKGAGVAQDQQEAFHWYQKAAEQGDVAAMFNTGNRYAIGNGTGRDFAKAYMWYHIAAEQGVGVAERSKQILAQQMSEEDMARAEAFIRGWRPNPAIIRK